MFQIEIEFEETLIKTECIDGALLWEPLNHLFTNSCAFVMQLILEI